MTRLSLILPLIVVLVAAAALPGCTSPLDTDTPRKETPLTPAPKVDPIAVTADFDFSGTDYAFKGTPVIKIDTTVTPMRFWLDFSMYETGTPSTAMLESFDVKIDSIAATTDTELLDGEVVMWADIGSGPQQFFCGPDFNRATIIIQVYPPDQPGGPTRAKITLYLIFNEDQGFQSGYPSQEVLGRIYLEI